MEVPPAAISPEKTRAQEDNSLSKICEEMKTWLSGSPAVKCVESADEQTKMKSSKPATAVSSKASSSILVLPKAASDANAESESVTSADMRKLEAATILSNGPSNLPAETEKAMSQLGTGGLTAQDDCGTPVGEEPEKIKSIGSSKSTPHASTLLSDTPLPAPLHIIQAATAVEPGEDVKRRLSWSVSNVCPTEGGHEDGSSSLSSVVDQEADSHIVHPSSVPNAQEKIAHEYNGSLLYDTTAEGSNCLIGAWLTKFRRLPSVTVPYENLCNESFVQCVIDTENGEFLPPIPQPETVRDMVDGPCEGYNDIGWRQVNMTSNLYMSQEIKSRENAAKTLRMTLEQLDHKPEPIVATGEEHWPKAKCVIRPAAPEDFTQIAEIINAEAANTCNAQIFQDKLAMADDVCKIFDACVARSRPFIVAIPAQDDFLDQSKWPKDSDEVYQEFAKYMAAKPKPAAPVAGFAFVSDYRMNLYGAPCLSSRYTGQVRLAVHPDHQRKLYGSALMDRLLLSISPFRRSTLDYIWECDDPKDVYQFPVTHNRRQYTQLYFEHFFSQGDSAAYQPGAEFLGKFGFQEIGYFKNAAVRFDDQHHNHWLNMVVWQTDITPTSKIVARPQLSGSAAGNN
ncbi:hypothetical protein H634G_07141 [Metarhizium anisopliae BRIP 53293]|uniref:N-acetyltransferase domain-containing protein n=1 Tax=Metarhizium anisopliae BRIP 53293 TaxID=1291518 RepID=A0A0D9NTL7_METAN|nr:hypothetical protein H634G_07141 [Metarhizium anisopliae BRIP 53293]